MNPHKHKLGAHPGCVHETKRLRLRLRCCHRTQKPTCGRRTTENLQFYDDQRFISLQSIQDEGAKIRIMPDAIQLLDSRYGQHLCSTAVSPANSNDTRSARHRRLRSNSTSYCTSSPCVHGGTCTEGVLSNANMDIVVNSDVQYSFHLQPEKDRRLWQTFTVGEQCMLSTVRFQNDVVATNPKCCSSKINAYIIRGIPPANSPRGGSLSGVVVSIVDHALRHGWNELDFDSVSKTIALEASQTQVTPQVAALPCKRV